MNGQIQYGPGRALTSETTPGPAPEFASRLSTFRHELHLLGGQPPRSDLERLIARARELGLRDEDIAEELAEITASLAALDLSDRITRDGLPVIVSLTLMPTGEPCHFATPVRFGRRQSDQFGHLELTSVWLKFHGALDLSVVWGGVAGVERAGRDIIVSLVDNARGLRFCCDSLDEAARGAVVARHLVQRVGAGSTESRSTYQAAL